MTSSNTAVSLVNDVCQISGVVDFDTAPKLLEQVSEQIMPNGSLVVDFSGVSHANSAALALLLAWQEEAKPEFARIYPETVPYLPSQRAHITV